MIEKLLWAGIIKDDRKGKYFHSLSYDKDFDSRFRELGILLLRDSIDEVVKSYQVFNKSGSHNEIFKKIYSLIRELENQEPNEEQEQQKKIAKTIRETKNKGLQEFDAPPLKRKSNKIKSISKSH